MSDWIPEASSWCAARTVVPAVPNHPPCFWPGPCTADPAQGLKFFITVINKYCVNTGNAYHGKRSR